MMTTPDQSTKDFLANYYANAIVRHLTTTTYKTTKVNTIDKLLTHYKGVLRRSLSQHKEVQKSGAVFMIPHLYQFPVSAMPKGDDERLHLNLDEFLDPKEFEVGYDFMTGTGNYLMIVVYYWFPISENE